MILRQAQDERMLFHFQVPPVLSLSKDASPKLSPPETR